MRDEHPYTMPPVNDEGYTMTDEELAGDADENDGQSHCCRCGKPTSWDPIYEDLCYRCCRARNE